MFVCRVAWDDCRCSWMYWVNIALNVLNKQSILLELYTGFLNYTQIKCFYVKKMRKTSKNAKYFEQNVEIHFIFYSDSAKHNCSLWLGMTFMPVNDSWARIFQYIETLRVDVCLYTSYQNVLLSVRDATEGFERTPTHPSEKESESESVHHLSVYKAISCLVCIGKSTHCCAKQNSKYAPHMSHVFVRFLSSELLKTNVSKREQMSHCLNVYRTFLRFLARINIC